MPRFFDLGNADAKKCENINSEKLLPKNCQMPLFFDRGNADAKQNVKTSKSS